MVIYFMGVKMVKRWSKCRAVLRIHFISTRFHQSYRQIKLSPFLRPWKLIKIIYQHVKYILLFLFILLIEDQKHLRSSIPTKIAQIRSISLDRRPIRYLYEWEWPWTTIRLWPNLWVGRGLLGGKNWKKWFVLEPIDKKLKSGITYSKISLLC